MGETELEAPVNRRWGKAGFSTRQSCDRVIVDVQIKLRLFLQPFPSYEAHVSIARSVDQVREDCGEIGFVPSRESQGPL